jgi:cell division protein FtsN
LQAQGLHARIEAGAGSNSRRILIGPFAHQAGVEKAQRKLQAQGILALERAY